MLIATYVVNYMQVSVGWVYGGMCGVDGGMIWDVKIAMDDWGGMSWVENGRLGRMEWVCILYIYLWYVKFVKFVLNVVLLLPRGNVL